MRKIFGPFINAWVSISSHKLRSFLTILGVVIGVGAVIALMSVGKGATNQIVSQLTSLGTNLVYVAPGASTSTGGVRGAMGSATTLTIDDAEAIEEEVANIEAIAPYSTSMAQVIAGSENTRATVTGVTPSYETVFGVDVLGEGYFITDYQYSHKSKVALLGATVAETLFGEEDPIGETIKMSNTVFTVIGVMDSSGSSTNSTDNMIIIPLTTLQTVMSSSRTTSGEYTVSQIVIQTTDKDLLDTVKADITYLLEERHEIGIDEDDDFSITTMDDLVDTISESTQTMTVLLGAIASISLVVGGIGVMNIMLVSVMERRREIGVRKALGAKESTIWGQFLVDSAVLTFTGGVIGVAVGWAVAYFVNYFDIMNTAVTLDIVVLAVAVSVGIGLFFGFYPAWQASKLNPIDALRSE